MVSEIVIEMVSMDWAKTTLRRDEKHLSFRICCSLYYRFDGNFNCHAENDELTSALCLQLTRDDQQLGDNKMYYSMSRFSACDTLYTPYDGDYRLEVKPGTTCMDW